MTSGVFQLPYPQIAMAGKRCHQNDDDDDDDDDDQEIVPPAKLRCLKSSSNHSNAELRNAIKALLALSETTPLSVRQCKSNLVSFFLFGL